jgi:HlyD family secretion protein
MSQEQASPDPILALPSFNDEDDAVGGGAPTPWWRQRRTIIIIAILLLIVLLAAILLPILNRRQPVTYQYQKVSRGSLSLTVSATGPIQSGIYNLVFTGTGGLIKNLYVTVGQSVKKGDKLAQLDPTALQDALNTAQASYLSAQANYNSAQNTYNQTQGQLQSSINAAQTTLSNAMNALTKTQAQSQSTVNGALQTLTNDQVALTNTQQSSQDSISSAQTALSNDQKALQAAQREAQTSNSAAQQAVNNAQSALNSASNQANSQISLAFQTEQQSLANCNSTTSSGTPTVPAPSAQCRQIAQDTYNQAVNTANSSVTTAQNSLSTAQRALSSTQATSNANITTAQGHISADQKALTTAQSTSQANNQTAQSKISSDQAALNTDQTSSASNNTTAQNSVNSAQSGLSSAQSQAGATGASSQGQVVTAQGQVNSALQAVTTAKHNLNNALLTAPHDGIVTTINGTVGGAPGTPLTGSSSTGTTTAGATFIQIVDTSALQIQANINETDTANLKVGEVASFTVNAYGNRAFRGTVASISPNGQTTSNVVTYPVSIDVDMSNTNLHDVTLLPGMTANVTITVLNRDNVLTIPVDAVNYARLASSASTSTSGSRPALVSRQEVTSALRQARQRLVELTNNNPQISNDNPLAAYILETANGQFVIKPVVLGLTDGTVYEVLDGLAENEVIVVGTSTGTTGGAIG